jgi:hypothetical protein
MVSAIYRPCFSACFYLQISGVAMNIRDIEHMWKVASNNPNHDTNWHDPVVIAFAALVEAAARADEREECIKLVHKGTGYPVQIKTLVILQKERKRIADDIRARGTT